MKRQDHDDSSSNKQNNDLKLLHSLLIQLGFEILVKEQEIADLGYATRKIILQVQQSMGLKDSFIPTLTRMYYFLIHPNQIITTYVSTHFLDLNMVKQCCCRFHPLNKTSSVISSEQGRSFIS
jgi:hypothetical protein